MFVILRLVSLILIVAALMLLGADAVTSLENGGEIIVRSLDQVWALFDKPRRRRISRLDWPAFCPHPLARCGSDTIFCACRAGR